MTQLAHNGQLSSEGINREMWIPKSDQVPVQIQLVRFSDTTLGHSFSNSDSDGANQLIPAVSLQVDRITDIADTWWSHCPVRLCPPPDIPVLFDYASLRVWECGGKILIAALGMRICFVFCVLYFVPASVKCRIWHYMTRISLLFRIILRKFRLSLLHINIHLWGVFLLEIW